MVGQGYDGAAAMSGKNNSVQKHTRDTISTAAYVHCSSHVLNLCLAKAAPVPPIRSADAPQETLRHTLGRKKAATLVFMELHPAVVASL